jgi:hypothetical protein
MRLHTKKQKNFHKVIILPNGQKKAPETDHTVTSMDELSGGKFKTF